MIKSEIAKIIREVDENDCIGNHELVAEVAERYAKQRPETGQVDAIVMLLEKKATELQGDSAEADKTCLDYYKDQDIGKCLSVSAAYLKKMNTT